MRQAELQRSYCGEFSEICFPAELSNFPLSSRSRTIFEIISSASLKICSFMVCDILSYEDMTFCHTAKFFSVFLSLRLENWSSIGNACQKACGGVAWCSELCGGHSVWEFTATLGLHTEKTSWSGAEAH